MASAEAVFCRCRDLHYRRVSVSVGARCVEKRSGGRSRRDPAHSANRASDIERQPAAYRARARTLAREAARRDARDAAANDPIDRAEARARSASQSAWSRHHRLSQQNPAQLPQAEADVITSGLQVPPSPDVGTKASSAVTARDSEPRIASIESPYTRADRAAVSLLLVPLLIGAMAVSAMNAWQASAKRRAVAEIVTEAAAAKPANASVLALAKPDAAVAGSVATPQPPPKSPRDLALAAVMSSPPEVLTAVPAQELISTEDPSTLIPSIAKESEMYSGRQRRCTIEEQPIAPGLALLSRLARSDASSAEFGEALAEAAQAQLGEFVVYTDSYKRLSFPMGDIPSLFGVCTDVVIRAYRTVGVDLQRLVHRARVGSGDPNIDHRRTEVLRRFFAANGRSLPVTDVADDYLPGDIVTYHRPQNSGSQSHIAIVSNTIAASGRPLIVHNRGWGPQLEDGLFVDQITGHYRYSGPSEPIAIGSDKPLRKMPLAKSVTLSRKTLVDKVKAQSGKGAASRQSDRDRTRPGKPVSGS